MAEFTRLTPRARLLSLSDVPTGDWTALLGERDLFLLPGWLQVGPGTYGGGLRAAQAALLDRGGSLVAGTAGWLFGSDCTEDLCRPDVLMGLPSDRGEGLFPTLLAGGWYDSRVAHCTETTSAEVAAVIDALERWASTQSAASVCWPSVDVRETTLMRLLEERGYLRFPLTPRWSLEGPWAGFDDYLAKLRSSRRVSVRAQ